MSRYCREQKLKPQYGIIYKVTNLVNNKIYIGQTERTLKERWKQHKYKEGCRYLHNAILKYGANNFKIEEIEKVPIEDLDEREIYWIAYYNSTDRTIGYNILKGGKLGRMQMYKLSPEDTKKLIELDKQNVPHTKIAEMFNIERKTVTFILRRETNYTTKFKTLKQRTDLKEVEEYLRKYNPTSKEAMKMFHFSPVTLFKFTKSIGYKFPTYQQRRRGEYNISKSAQQPTAKVG